MAVALLEELGQQFLSTALGYGVGGAIQPAIEPFVRDLAAEINRLHPSMRLSPPDLAQMVVQGIRTEADAAGEAAENGVDGDRFDDLVRLAGEPPGAELLLSMLDRGIIDETRTRHGLLQSRLKPEWIDAVLATNPALLSVPDLAEMVVQGVIEQPEATRLAGQLSYTPEQFERLVRLAGSPPGPETMLDLWNRGLADEVEVDRALRQSRLKPEWIELLKSSRLQPASLAAAVNAVVKERIPEQRGLALAAMHGVDAETFRMLVDEAGRPMPTGQALTLVRRGQMTEAEFREVVARSDVKTDYTEHLLQLRTVYPSLAQMRAIIGSGAMPDDQARSVLRKLGYTAEVVEGIVAAGHGAKLAGTRQLSQTAIIDGYKDRAIEHDQAVHLLAGIGYDADDAALILGVADYELLRSYRAAVVAIVKARFLQHDIDDATASQWLDRIGLPSQQRDQLLDLWRFDVEANPHLLTLAQLTAAHKAGILDAAQYRAYLPRLGYVEPELTILAQLYSPG